MTGGRRRSSGGRLVALLIVLLLCIWLLYRLFIGIPPAPPPEVKTGTRSTGEPAAQEGGHPV